jgi:hypothetical protein
MTFGHRRSRRSRRVDAGVPRGTASNGQAVVEFALILPILVVLLLADVAMARIYTTMVNVESAAREAADYGTFGSQKWDPALYNLPGVGTVDQMKHRACVASSKLPDYVGPDDNCSNPTVTYQLSGDRGATWSNFDAAMACDDATREPPCWLKVTLHYDFHLIAPLNLSVFGVTYGIPSTIAIDRASVFPVTDLSLP